MNETNTPGAYDPEEIRLFRKEKDEMLRAPGSPIPEGKRPSFQGLSYFEPTASYSFRSELTKFSPPQPVTLGTSDGKPRQMLRYGSFSFELEGRTHTLIVFKNLDAAARDELFVPFRDATNGGESYAAGRYLSLSEGEGVDGLYRLDFNLAYNPYCAYNPGYSCPLVPSENVLDVAIKAGEKSFPGGYE